MKELLVLCSPSDSHLGLFDDLHDYPRALLRYITIKRLPIIGDLVGRILLGHRINKSFNVPYKYLWTNYKCENLDTTKYVLVTNSALYYLNINYLRQLKEKGLKLFLLMTDALDADSFIIKGFRSLILSDFWDRIYTFDKKDSEKYGFYYSGFHYYSVNKYIQNNIPSKPLYDAYFVGAIKGGREYIINNTYKHLTSKGCKCYFDLSAGGKKVERLKGVHYHIGWISYLEVLKSVSNSKCIIEIMQENQTGATLRYFEAVCYNKKLLTNNKNIIKFPYYNERWMKIFESPADIDINWIVKDEDIDYHYSSDFSPIRLVEKILREVETI